LNKYLVISFLAFLGACARVDKDAGSNVQDRGERKPPEEVAHVRRLPLLVLSEFHGVCVPGEFGDLRWRTRKNLHFASGDAAFENNSGDHTIEFTVYTKYTPRVEFETIAAENDSRRIDRAVVGSAEVIYVTDFGVGEERAVEFVFAAYDKQAQSVAMELANSVLRCEIVEQHPMGKAGKEASPN
jgi:hypothetical protein